MDNSTSTTRFLEWSLGALHVSLFFWLFAAVLYLTGNLGNLLASLNTLIGVAVFAFLWLTTWWSTRQVVRRLARTPGWNELRVPVRAALALSGLWGGVNGLLFFAVPFVVVSLAFVGFATIADLTSPAASRDLTGIFALLVSIVVGTGTGSVIAFLIGGLVGFVFALLDLVLLASSKLLLQTAR